MKRSALLAEAEALYASVPSPVALTSGSPRPALTAADPRATGGGAVDKAAYDVRTKAWLASGGWRSVRGFTGKAVLIERNSERVERVTIETFATNRAFFDTSSGRLCFSGPCTLRAGYDDEPDVRTVTRPNPATTQLFIGQEGYILKFQGVKVDGEVRPQPYVSLGLLSAHLDGLPEILGDPGSPILRADVGKAPVRIGTVLGYPFAAGTAKLLRGAVAWPDPLQQNVAWKLAWECRPA